MNTNNKWGFIRETREKAQNAEKKDGIHRTGLEDYLKIIFPDIKDNEWIHDTPAPKLFDNKRVRPDYRCDKLKLIVEFDGVQHYKQPDTIKKDKDNQTLYESKGYIVIRIPYFIQLTNEVVKTMFGVDVKVPLFDPTIPSMESSGRNTPAFCCPAGLKRMAEDFKKYPQQYKVNMDALKKENDEFLTGYEMLKEEYDKI